MPRCLRCLARAQGLQHDVDNLILKAQSLRTDALNSVGVAAWQKLSELGLTLLDLDRKRAELQKCIDAHSGAFVIAFNAIDAGGGGTADERRADLWDVSGAQPVLVESVPVQSGSFAFKGAAPGRAARGHNRGHRHSHEHRAGLPVRPDRDDSLDAKR